VGEKARRKQIEEKPMKSWLIGLAAMAASAAVPGLANAKDFTIGLSQESLDHPLARHAKAAGA
jgi:hypothetical protein